MKRQIAALLASTSLFAATGVAVADSQTSGESATPVTAPQDRNPSNQPERTSDASESGESK